VDVPVTKAPDDRSRMIEALHDRYTGGSAPAARFRYWRKKLLWHAVVGGSLALKRLLDLIGAVVGLVGFAPIFALTALCILIEDGPPVLYRQIRVGRRGKRFAMYKFRSMVKNAESLKGKLEEQNESGGVIFKIRRDPRITRVGRIVRKLSIDELPQFWNVFTGAMSLVGPRPPVPEEVEQYGVDDLYRLEVKPGITCLWQIKGRSELSFEQQVALDRQYIESQSLALDLVILLKTIPAVLSGRGAY
jgi:lipopolysaccharide/colanic/teichoic acid biosynthesis glycosyltransferase